MCDEVMLLSLDNNSDNNTNGQWKHLFKDKS